MIREAIDEFFCEKGIKISSQEIDELSDAIMACLEYASYPVSKSSDNSEIAKLKRELEIEKNKIVCLDCKGLGVEVFHGPYHSAHSKCPKCKGEGKTSP